MNKIDNQAVVKPKKLNIFQRPEWVSIALTLLVFVILMIFKFERLFHPVNLESLMTSIAPIGLCSIGMMLLLITGVFDLSVGSVMALGGLMSAITLSWGVSPFIAILLGMIVGLLIGFVNGALVEFAGINALIATIGTQYVARGLSEILLVGKGKGGYAGFPEGFKAFGQNKFPGALYGKPNEGIYWMFLVMLVIMVLVQIYLWKARGGRRLYFIGGNEDASRLMGIKIRKIRINAFLLSGCLAALAGIFETAYSDAANRYTGVGKHMQVIICCIIGGGSMAGGQGSMVGALFGTIFMALLQDAFNIFSVPSQYQSICTGAILVIVVAVDGITALRKQRELGKI